MKTSLLIQKNFFGGITAAVIALPLALAFGVASGMGATAGLYGAIILGFFAALLGGTPTQISGPTGPMTVVIAAAVVTLNNDMNLLTSVILLAGVFQIIFSISKVGKFIQYIPYPVISGFMSGIGIIIIILQINPFLGLPSEATIIHILFDLPKNLTQANLDAVILASATLIIMFFTPSVLSRIIPSPLLALILLTPISIYFNLDVLSIGEIPITIPDLIIPHIEINHYKTIISLAFTLAVLGTIDSLLTSIVADSITHTKHNSDKELFAQGIGNSLCSLVGGLPGAGATMRTVINIKSGGTNKISGIVHSLTLLTVILFFAPLASQIPLAILSGILIKVGLDILDYRFLQVWKESPKYDLIVMLAVFFVTVFIDLITAVGVGIVLSSLLVVYRITKETNITLNHIHEGDILYDLRDIKARIIKIDGAFFFGSSTFFEKEVNSMLDIKTIIIDISEVPFIDITAIFTLKDLIAQLHQDNIKVLMVLKDKDKLTLQNLNKKHIFDNVEFFYELEVAVANISE